MGSLLHDTVNAVIGMLVFGSVTLGAAGPSVGDPFQRPYPDETGTMQTYYVEGNVDPNNPFFKSLGTNGRSCASCHQVSHGMTINPDFLQDRFDETAGLDPVFRLVDGANAPNLDVSTIAARQSAYSMLLSRGTIRIGIGVPANAEFKLTAVDDPYHYASAAELSLFRRPLPSTNAAFLSAVMWDGRFTIPGQSITEDLATQATQAVLGHEQGGTPPTPEQLALIIGLQRNIYTAQHTNTTALDLSAAGATGGAKNLSAQSFYVGINDSEGFNPYGQRFNPISMRLYDAWSGLSGSTVADARAQIARGEVVFNTKPITITNVAGFNDVLNQTVVVGSCTSCHDSPNVASHSFPTFMHTGVSDGVRRTPDLPLYTLQCNSTGVVTRTTDPGRALITGKCVDIGKFKVPSLRGLDVRSPYFHDGSGDSFQSVVDFYNSRFKIGLTSEEQADLIAFLETL